jgi:hypothetical protein
VLQLPAVSVHDQPVHLGAHQRQPVIDLHLDPTSPKAVGHPARSGIMTGTDGCRQDQNPHGLLG